MMPSPAFLQAMARDLTSEVKLAASRQSPCAMFRRVAFIINNLSTKPLKLFGR